MSKFFNQTHKALQQTSRSPRPVGSEVDVQEVVGALKKSLDIRDRAASSAGDINLKPLLAPPGGEEVASQVAAGRLQKCRAVRLPRNNERSFLSTQYGPDLQAAVEAFRTLRTRLLKKQAKLGLRSLAITSTAQGEGKTLTSLNLALSYSHLQDRSILLVDSDLRTKGLSTLLGLNQFIGLSDILEKGLSFESAILRTDHPNLYVLPAGTSTVPAAELFSRATWKEFVAWSGETFQMMLADSPPVLDLADTEMILAACESILLVTRAGKTKRQALTRIVNQVDNKKLAGVVFNGCEEAASKNYYRYSYSPQARAAEVDDI